MSATQKRWLSQPGSKLGKVDLTTALRKDAAWELLSPEVRQEIYDLLPKPLKGEQAHDIDVHPLKSVYKQHIEEELRRWQEDLKDGKEVKKWREEAMQAGHARANGEWDEWQKKQRDEDWKKDSEPEAEKANGKTEEAVKDEE